jgi:hypothetical protein
MHLQQHGKILMAKTVVAKEVGSDLLLYDPDLDEVHILNTTAQLIYRLSREGKAMQEIEQHVREHLDTKGAENIQQELEQGHADLQAKGLLG